MTIHTHDDAYEPAHTASQTAHALDELQLYGYRPFDGPDPRPMPDGQRLAVAVADIFDALVATLEDTRMEPDLEEVLWGQVNLFHRATARIERSLDENEQAEKLEINQYFSLSSLSICSPPSLSLSLSLSLSS